MTANNNRNSDDDVYELVSELWDVMEEKYIVSKLSRQQLGKVLDVDPNPYTVDDIFKVLAGPGGEDETQNFMIRLISPDSDDKYHVKPAFQFLHAMVETKKPYWDEYIARTLKISRKDFQDKDRGNSILHEAARIGCCKQLFEKYLRDNSEVVNMLNAVGETPLHIAAEYGHVDDVKMLLEFGAEIMEDEDGSTPLHSAAMSLEPSAAVVQLLVQKMSLNEQLNLKITETGDTALHCAAKNRKITMKVIAALKTLEPLKRNDKKETVFHLAAKSSNQKTLLAVLSTFSPTKSGWDIDDVEYEQETDCLINICARNGNAKGVVALIENGADLDNGVLHVIIEESVKHPEKMASLKQVYRKITECANLWDEVNSNSKKTQKGSLNYDAWSRNLMINLIAGKIKICEKNKETITNAIEYAIELGASEMLVEIVNTKGAFKVRGGDVVSKSETIEELLKYDAYDVTDFIEETRHPPKTITETEDEEGIKPAETPYLNSILSRYYGQWRDTGILSKQPIARLSEPFIDTVQRVYFVLGIIQMAYMVWFTVRNINENFLPITNNIERRCFVIWPVMVIVCTIISFLIATIRVIRQSCRNEAPMLLSSCRIAATRIGIAFIDRCTLFAFCIAVFAFVASKSDDRETYLMSMSMVLLFGWMACLLILAGCWKKTYVFTILLRELIVKDILLCFGILFIFVVVAFSTSIHVLRQLPSSSNETSDVTLDTTVFQVFILSMGLGEEILSDSTSKQDPGSILFKIVFAVYMLMSAIILLNILIALMSKRFDDVLLRAETEWRFEVLTLALDINRVMNSVLCHCHSLCRPCLQILIPSLIPLHPVKFNDLDVYYYGGKPFLHRRSYKTNSDDEDDDEYDANLPDYRLGRYLMFVEREEN